MAEMKRIGGKFKRQPKSYSEQSGRCSSSPEKNTKGLFFRESRIGSFQTRGCQGPLMIAGC